MVNDERGVRIFRVLDTVKVLQESTDCGWRVVCEGDESGRFLETAIRGVGKELALGAHNALVDVVIGSVTTTNNHVGVAATLEEAADGAMQCGDDVNR